MLIETLLLMSPLRSDSEENSDGGQRPRRPQMSAPKPGPRREGSGQAGRSRVRNLPPQCQLGFRRKWEHESAPGAEPRELQDIQILDKDAARFHGS